MILYLYWGICIISVFLYSISHPKKLANQKYILLLLFLFQFILLGWSRGAYDVEIGISRYIDYKRLESNTEIGFNFLVKFFHFLQFDYRSFFIVCSFVEIYSMFWFTKKNCDKSHIAICLFMIFPLVVFFQYIRTLTAIPFLLIALDSLINKRKHYIIKYILFCLIASMFHFSSIFFLLYLPIIFFNKKITVISTCIVAIVLQVVANISFFYNLVEKYLGIEKVNILEKSTGAEGAFGRIFYIVLCIFLFYFVTELLKRNYKVSFKEKKDDIYWKINFLSILCIPLTLKYGVGFARLPTIILLFNYPYLTQKISEVVSQKNRLQIYSVVVLYLIGLCVLNFRNLEYRQLVLYPFFEQNELIDWLFGWLI